MPRRIHRSHSSLWIECRTAGCVSYCVIAYDADPPKEWTCPVCEDALEQQMVDDLERRDKAARMVRASSLNPNVILCSEDF